MPTEANGTNPVCGPRRSARMLLVRRRTMFLCLNILENMGEHPCECGDEHCGEQCEGLAALDLAVETLKRSGLAVEANELLGLREKVMALVPRSKAARLETDNEVLLEA